MKLSAGQRVLDIGCGAGTFLLELIERDQVAGTGVDFKDLSHLPAIKQVDFRCGLLAEQALPARAYSLITMWHFLEHDYDPNATLARCRDLLADDGGLCTARAGTVVAIMSTVNPKTVQQFADARKPSGVHVVDSTVCGGGAAADEGTLLSFVGGQQEVVARLTPVLQAYSANVVHTGGVGTAQVAKAANNLIMWACLIANNEALALARRYGLDIETLRKTLLLSSGANKPLEKWGLQTMAWAEDDLVIVQEMAAECGVSLPQAGLNREICRALKPPRYKVDQYGI